MESKCIWNILSLYLLGSKSIFFSKIQDFVIPLNNKIYFLKSQMYQFRLSVRLQRSAFISLCAYYGKSYQNIFIVFLHSCPFFFILFYLKNKWKNFGKVLKFLRKRPFQQALPCKKLFIILFKRRASFTLTSNLLYGGVTSDSTGLSCSAENGTVRWQKLETEVKKIITGEVIDN